MKNTWDGFGQGLIKGECPTCGSNQVNHLDSNKKYDIAICECPLCKDKFEIDFSDVWPVNEDRLVSADKLERNIVNALFN